MPDLRSRCWTLPAAHYFSIEDTSQAGRAVFAAVNIVHNTHLLTTNVELSPIAHVISRSYRKEVCAWCFLYDRGRDWKVKNNVLGIAFCSTECQTTWTNNHDEECINAFEIIENFTKTLIKRQKDHQSHESLKSISGEAHEMNLAENPQLFWGKIEAAGVKVCDARHSVKQSKVQRMLLRQAVDCTPDADILAYVLSGIIAAYKSSSIIARSDTTTTSATNAELLLPSLFELAEDDQVFLENPMTTSPLFDYTSAYLVAIALLPVGMLELISTHLVINLASRASHNAFSIRPEGVTDGEQSGEFLGWGVWPEASFFNHSCQPNVRKDRKGRQWTFYTDSFSRKVVKDGEQLCITYLGGDEKSLDVIQRRKKLREQWGFTCLCGRCLQESGEANSSKE